MFENKSKTKSKSQTLPSIIVTGTSGYELAQLSEQSAIGGLQTLTCGNSNYL